MRPQNEHPSREPPESTRIMEEFKYAIFGFEQAALPDELRIVDLIIQEFQKLPHAQDTRFEVSGSLDAAGAEIDAFKAKTCGSAYNLALFNLNQFSSPAELTFLLGAKVLGDPRSVFLATLRTIHGPVYSIAREKVEREAEAIAQGTLHGAPSCIDSYTSAGRTESAALSAQILNAHLEETEQRARTKQTGIIFPNVFSKASELMRRSTTIFCGHRPSAKVSTRVSAIRNPKTSGRTPPRF